jgi:regulatory protein YycI of two-component signal transduction system YycFG
MHADVQVIEGGRLIKTEKMKLIKVKDFSDNTTLYENEDGRAVMYFKEKNEYILISIDMS